MKAMMTAVLAGGVLVDGVASVGHDEPTRTSTPRVQGKPTVAALVTPNSLYAATGAPPVVVFGTNGSLGIGGAHTAAGPGATPSDRQIPATVDHDPSLMSTSMVFAPTTFARPASPSSDSRSAVSVAPVPAVGIPGLFSPTGAFLGLIGPGGLLIGDGVLPGQNGGWLIGNGADGGPGQDGGRGGLLFGNGGNGGNGYAGHPNGGNGGNGYAGHPNGGNGCSAGLFGNGGNGGAVTGTGTAVGGNGGDGGTAAGTGDGGDGGDGGGTSSPVPEPPTAATEVTAAMPGPAAPGATAVTAEAEPALPVPAKAVTVVTVARAVSVVAAAKAAMAAPAMAATAVAAAPKPSPST
jgi:hypothetical protein